MRSNTIAVRLFAWIATITSMIILFRIGNWAFYEFVLTVVDFLVRNEVLFRIIEIILFIGLIVSILIITGFIFKWIIHLFEKEKIAYMWSIVGCGFFTVFYAYICFAPYFYTENFLTEIGTERVQDLALLTSDELTAAERIKKAKKTMTMGEARQQSTEQIGFPLENIDIVSIDVINLERSFNQYTYTAKIVQNNRNKTDEVVEWKLKIKPGFFTFLVDGYQKNY